MSSTESRLAAVERQLRFHRAVIAALLVALVALMGYAATEGVPDEIRTKSLKIIGEDGKIVLEINADEKEPWVWITDSIKNLRIGKNFAAFIENPSGKTISAESIYLRVPPSGGVGEWKTIMALTNDGSGNGLLKIKNKEGKDIIYAGASVDGDGLLTVANKQGKDLIYAGADAGGDGLLKVINKDGKDGVQVYGMSKEGGGGGIWRSISRWLLMPSARALCT